jgi:hypothetical protein
VQQIEIKTMKNSLTNLKLWQKIINVLPVEGNPQVDWAKMKSLLDAHLPVTNTDSGLKPPGDLYSAFSRV